MDNITRSLLTTAAEATKHTMTGFDQLDDRVQSLPPELYNTIYDLTFTAYSIQGANVELDSSYRPPSCLQVSKASRDEFAASYYAHTIFMFSQRASYTESITTGVNWLVSLPPEHVAMIRCLRYNTYPHSMLAAPRSVMAQNAAATSMVARAIQSVINIRAQLNSSGVMLKSGVLQVNVRCLPVDEEVWTKWPTPGLVLGV